MREILFSFLMLAILSGCSKKSEEELHLAGTTWVLEKTLINGVEIPVAERRVGFVPLRHSALYYTFNEDGSVKVELKISSDDLPAGLLPNTYLIEMQMLGMWNESNISSVVLNNLSNSMPFIYSWIQTGNNIVKINVESSPSPGEVLSEVKGKLIHSRSFVLRSETENISTTGSKYIQLYENYFTRIDSTISQE